MFYVCMNASHRIDVDVDVDGDDIVHRSYKIPHMLSKIGMREIVLRTT